LAHDHFKRRKINMAYNTGLRLALATSPDKIVAQPQSPLLSLAAEIGNKVYQHYFTRESLVVDSEGRFKVDENYGAQPSPCLALLQTCCQARVEATPVFFQTVLFGPACHGRAIPMVSFIGEERAKLIKKMYLKPFGYNCGHTANVLQRATRMSRP
jgi:hypothetical protein